MRMHRHVIANTFKQTNNLIAILQNVAVVSARPKWNIKSPGGRMSDYVLECCGHVHVPINAQV